MYEILLVFHVLIAIMLIVLILIQHGKGAQAGAAFGSGASQTVFGSQGSGGFLSRSTGTLAAVFFVINLALAFIINRSTHRNVVENFPTATQSVRQEEATQKPVEEKKEGPATGAHPAGGDIPEVP